MGLSKRKPSLTVVTGAVCVGKTTYIENEFGLKQTDPPGTVIDGRILINASQVVHHLEEIPNQYPLKHYASQVDEILKSLLEKALLEKLDIVCELIGTETEKLNQIMKDFKEIGYECRLVQIEEDDLELCLLRNQHRDQNAPYPAWFVEELNMSALLEKSINR